jgi:hypothetical protein
MRALAVVDREVDDDAVRPNDRARGIPGDERATVDRLRVGLADRRVGRDDDRLLRPGLPLVAVERITATKFPGCAFVSNR